MTNQTEYAYQVIKNKILDGEYKPSENLVESNLAKELGVSRNTIKKVFLLLDKEGLVEVEDNKCAHVKSFTLEEVINYLQVREVLEGLVAELTAPTISEDKILELEKMMSQMEYCIENNSLMQYSAFNIQFHDIIYNSCKNQQAVELINTIKTQLRRFHLRTILIPGRSANSIQEHKNLFNAIKNRDGQEAGKFARLHIANVREIIVNNYQILI